MYNEIDLALLWRVFKNSFIKMVIFALIIALSMGLFTYYFIDKKYSSSVSFYVINANTSQDYTQTAYLSAAAQLANDYIEIIRGDIMIEDIVDLMKEEYGVEYTPNQIRKMRRNKKERKKREAWVKLAVIHVSLGQSKKD